MFSQFSSTGAPALNCSAIGFASMFLALTAAAIAAAIVFWIVRNPRAVALAVVGLVAGLMVLYLLSIATFAVGGA